MLLLSKWNISLLWISKRPFRYLFIQRCIRRTLKKVFIHISKNPSCSLTILNLCATFNVLSWSSYSIVPLPKTISPKKQTILITYVGSKALPVPTDRHPWPKCLTINDFFWKIVDEEQMEACPLEVAHAILIWDKDLFMQIQMKWRFQQCNLTSDEEDGNEEEIPITRPHFVLKQLGRP